MLTVAQSPPRHNTHSTKSGEASGVHSSPTASPDPCSLTAALALERLGLSCIPLPAGSKVAARRWGRWQRQRPTPALLRRWWREEPGAGVAVVCGQVSGVVVLDLDGAAGLASVAGRPNLRETACAQTPRGWHFYFRLPPGVTLPRKIGLLPGVDLLGEGGYAVAPPGDGRTWAIPPEEGFALCPSWIVDLALAQTPPQRLQAAPTTNSLPCPPARCLSASWRACGILPWPNSAGGG